MTTDRAPLRTLFTLVSCCLLTEPAFAQALPRARPEDVGLSTAALDRITTTLQSYVDSRKYPGFLAVIARHGKLAYIASVGWMDVEQDRKSTRLNSSHVEISYAVFCLKKKI